MVRLSSFASLLRTQPTPVESMWPPIHAVVQSKQASSKKRGSERRKEDPRLERRHRDGVSAPFRLSENTAGKIPLTQSDGPSRQSCSGVSMVSITQLARSAEPAVDLTALSACSARERRDLRPLFPPCTPPGSKGGKGGKPRGLWAVLGASGFAQKPAVFSLLGTPRGLPH